MYITNNYALFHLQQKENLAIIKKAQSIMTIMQIIFDLEYHSEFFSVSYVYDVSV